MSSINSTISHRWRAKGLRALALCSFLFVPSAVVGQTSIEPIRASSYSFIEEGERVPFDLATVASELISSNVEYLSVPKSDLLADDSALRKSEILTKLSEAMEIGGASAGAAEIILTAAELGRRKCEETGMVIHGSPLLGRSEMRGVQYARLEDEDVIGRGQLDIQTTKFILCRNLSSNEIVGHALNIRWVININGSGFRTTIASEGDVLPGPNGRAYKQRLQADGADIQVVLFAVGDTIYAKDHPVYDVVEQACIDIWLVETLDDNEIWLRSSTPDYGSFCAGGYCKDNDDNARPPYLDATM